jgi:hypothetical protein
MSPACIGSPQWAQRRSTLLQVGELGPLLREVVLVARPAVVGTTLQHALLAG